MIESIKARITLKSSLLVAGLVLIFIVTVIIWQSDIDWEEQIRAYGYFGVFIVSLGSTATILCPLPGEVALFTAPVIMDISWLGVFWLGVVASVGATIGELTAYYAGRWGRTVAADKHMKNFEKTAHRMKRYGGMTIFLFALTPLPFDIVGIVAGTLRFPVRDFLAFCWVGRLVRSLIVVYAGWYGWSSVERLLFGG